MGEGPRPSGTDFDFAFDVLRKKRSEKQRGCAYGYDDVTRATDLPPGREVLEPASAVALPRIRGGIRHGRRRIDAGLHGDHAIPDPLGRTVSGRPFNVLFFHAFCS